KTLKNDMATREGIIDRGLGTWLIKQPINNHSLVIVTFSGHGMIDPATRRYQFAPQDYDRDKSSSGIFLADLDRFWRVLDCTVVVILDTCHSGAVKEGEDDELTNPDNLLGTIQKSVTSAGSKRGLVVMAACGRYQKANETDRWGHGAMTLALLEGIEGKHLYKADGYLTPLPKPRQNNTITLQELDTYMADRVQVLSTEISQPQFRRQGAKTYVSGGISLEQIPILRTK
ncbi:MAG TPA: caspase family protein, partial [Gemmataceae bacterium]|nr:caspase family protein [Gemmataceae bacterium]